MDYSIFDLESTGLSVNSRIHCLSVNQFRDGQNRRFTLTDRQEMIDFIEGESCLIGHNIIRFDLPVLEYNLNIKIKARIVDTLGVSWYLAPEQKKHGLEYWGEYFGVPKPEITDWENLPIEEYIHRCSEDVRINTALWDMQSAYLNQLYNGSPDRILYYITFKLNVARQQEITKWRLDIERCQSNLTKLEVEADIKIQNLIKIMPEVVEYKTYEFPDEKLFKKDAAISKKGSDWFYLLGKLGLPQEHTEPVIIEVDKQPGNPGSTDQLKDWLFKLGWQPDVFKYVKEKDADGKPTGANRAIPQINKQTPEVGISESIKSLYSIEPGLENLDSLSLLNHRIGILKGFLSNVDAEGYLQAQVSGFTNTMRFKHTTIVNLPTIHIPYGKEMRECLTCPEGYTLCGTDMSSLEDTTKQHYMYYFDPDYVTEMRVPGFDPHLDIAKLSGMITEDDVKFYKEIDYHKTISLDTAPPDIIKRFKEIKSIRATKAKKTNFSATYGAGPAKIAITAKVPFSEAKLLHGTYWIRNRAVKQVAKAVKTKTVNGQMWLFNPVSRFWYSLRGEKDRFSVLNQSTAVYCFDTWVNFVIDKYSLCGQFHDEMIIPILDTEESKENCTFVLRDAIKKTNEQLRLNVPLNISIDYGYRYSDIH